MNKPPKVANFSITHKLVGVAGISMWSARAQDESQALIICFSSLSLAWPRFAAAMSASTIAYHVSKDSMGRAVLVLSQQTWIGDSTSQVRYLLQQVAGAKSANQVFYVDRGWLSAAVSQPSKVAETSNAGEVLDYGAVSESKVLMKPRRVSLRQKLLVGGLVVVLLVLAVMVRPLAYQNPQQIGQGLTASTAPETRAAQIASEAAQVSNITLTQIEKIVRKQLPNLTNATFDGDRLLDGLVRAHHDVSVVRLNALGGLAQLSFTVSGYQGMVEISMEHFESEWMLTSIK